MSPPTVTLRAKLVAALALLAAAATVSVGVFSYRATAARLDVEVNRSLTETLQGVLARPRDALGLGPRRRGPAVGPLDNRPLDNRPFDLVVVQITRPDGVTLAAEGAVVLPMQVAGETFSSGVGVGPAYRNDVEVDGQRYRVLTTQLRGGGTVQVGRSLAENERLLRSLRDRTFTTVLLVVAAASALGALIARQVTRRLVELTAAAQQVASTGRLDVPVPVEGSDEAGRLGAAFNEMLAALARSRDDQQRLVQDAGHELRTPLTSVRTNVAVLRSLDRLTPGARARLLDDLEGETQELSHLVNELVELAVDQRDEEPISAVVLRDIAERVAERTRRRTGRTVTVDADDAVVAVRPAAVERAVGNLVENAVKFSDEGPIEVVVRRGRVEVLDRGPGIAAEDLPHLFDRFYRAVDARSRPGSGLGLSIVRGVAEAHRGAAFATPREGGGSVVGFSLPVSEG